MLCVFFCRYPLKVFNVVVCLYKVFVVHLQFSKLRVITLNEVRGNKYMHILLCGGGAGLMASGYVNAQVPACGQLLF